MNDSNYIAHHGVKGQKWGVRRFQNPDGTRTALGKSRSMSMKDRIKARSEQKAEAKAEKKAASAEERHEKLKKQVVRNPKDLYKYKDEFSKSEIESLIKDIEFDRKIKDIRVSEIKRRIDSYGRLKDILNTTYQVMDNSKNIYNTVADINNAFIDAGKSKGKRMTKIGASGGDQQKKEQPKKDESKKEDSKK